VTETPNLTLRQRPFDFVFVVFGVEFFGGPEWRTQNPRGFLAFNLPDVLIPLLLLIRMRKPEPFTQRF
jgi:hypothetical protein